MSPEPDREADASPGPEEDVEDGEQGDVDEGVVDVGADATPEMDVPEMDVPEMDVPEMDVPEMDVPEMDVDPVEPVACVPDLERLGADQSCQRDEHCPCGSHCELGQCAYECLEGIEDCAEGQRCTTFGRCVALEDGQELADVPAAAQGVVVFLSDRLLIADRGEVVAIDFRVERADIAELRVGDGVALANEDGELVVAPLEAPQVNCTDDSAEGFAESCTLRDLEVGSAHRVFLRPGLDAGRAVTWSLRFHTRGGARLLSVDIVEAPPEFEPVTEPVTGVYEGSVQIATRDGRALLTVPVSAEVLEHEAGLRVFLEDSSLTLSPAGALWGRQVEEGFTFHWDHFLGGEGQTIGDVDIHIGMHSAEGLSGSGAGFLSGRFEVLLAGFLPADEYLVCAGVQAFCGFGDQSPCCGHTSTGPGIFEQAFTAFDAVLTLQRRGELPQGATVNDFDQSAADSVSDFPNMKSRVYSPDAGSPWDVAVKALLDLGEINPAVDSRFDLWASLEPQAQSLLECELSGFIETDYSCRGPNSPFGQNIYEVCPPGVAEQLPQLCDTFSRRCLNDNDDSTCLFQCQVEVGDDFRVTADLPSEPSPFDNLPVGAAAICAQRAFCYQPPDVDVQSFETGSTLMWSDELDISGDLPCADPDPFIDQRIPTSIGLFNNADVIARGGEGLNARQMLEACYEDLAREVPDLSNDGPNWNGGHLRRVFQSRGCVDLARFWTALRHAVLPAALLATDPQARNDPEDESYPGLQQDHRLAHALTLRLFSQWLQLHQFLANEGLDAHRMARALRLEETPPEDAEVPDLRALRSVLSGAWEVFLRPRFVTGLMGIPAEQLLLADYRRVAFPQIQLNPQGHHEQGVGLPVFMVEAMSSYLEVLHGESEEVWATGRQIRAQRERGAEAVRQSLILESLAVTLVARSGVGQNLWRPRFESSRVELNRVRGRLIQVLKALDGEANLLGVEDEDLPLYFNIDDAGMAGRASVVSRYFLDEGDGLASNAIDSADQALSRARTAWSRLRSGILQDRNHRIQAEERQVATAQKYGQTILQICGSHGDWSRPDDPDDTSPVRSEEAVEWLQSQSNFASCMLDTSRDECRYDERLLLDDLREGELEFQLCRGLFYRLRYPQGPGFRAPATQAALLRLAEGFSAEDERGQLVRAAEALSEEEVLGFFEGVEGLEAVSATHKAQAEQVCGHYFPGVRRALPNLQTVEGSPFNDPTCFMGSLGESTLNGLQARKSMEAAEAEIERLIDAYDIAVRSCHLASELGDAQEALTEEHLAVMNKLRAARLAATLVKEVTATSWLDHVTSFGSKAVSAVAATSAQSLSDAMDRAQENHALAMTRYQNFYEDLICFNDAKLHMVGMRTAQINLERAALAVEQTVLRNRTLLSRLDNLVAEGQVAAARAEGWQRPPVAYDQWLDDDVDGFIRSMRRARRVAYLAVRAVEYEFQMSSAERADVLSASHPGELREAMANVRSVSDTLRINGLSPENYNVVFSLKRHLLQLASHEDFPESFHRLNDQQRFRALLSSERFAIYDDRDGTYLGQRVPFRVTPFEGQRNEGEFSLPVISASRDCAERLWSLNVALDGEELLPEDAVQRSVRVEVLQKNSFFSRWCANGQDSEYQVQAIEPSRNLLRDPFVGAPNGIQQPSVGRFPGWTRARVDARLNIDGQEFGREDYTENASTELAARGLYGEYAIFFPAQMLRAVNPQGLELRQLDDVRIRMDFTSFAQ